MIILPQINFNWFIIIIIISRLGSFPPMEFHTHTMYIHMYMFIWSDPST